MCTMMIACWNDLTELIKKTGWESSPVFGDNVYYICDPTYRVITKLSEEKFEYTDDYVKYRWHYPLKACLNDFSPTDLAFFNAISIDGYMEINLGTPIVKED